MSKTCLCMALDIASDGRVHCNKCGDNMDKLSDATVYAIRDKKSGLYSRGGDHRHEMAGLSKAKFWSNPGPPRNSVRYCQRHGNMYNCKNWEIVRLHLVLAKTEVIPS